MTVEDNEPLLRRTRWGRSIVVALAGLVAFVLVLRISFAGITHDDRPTETLRWAPFDGFDL
jgi:hypothetical protein